ncbi:MAG: hypothetical protein M3N95_06270 [Actinomycetota bacterium]|nr:hypothetical protein [Actinomycetota bacterium]
MIPNLGHIIVGARAAGVSAAVAMRKAGYDGAMAVIDSDPNQPYERPPLPKSLIGAAAATLRSSRSFRRRCTNHTTSSCASV